MAGGQKEQGKRLSGNNKSKGLQRQPTGGSERLTNRLGLNPHHRPKTNLTNRNKHLQRQRAVITRTTWKVHLHNRGHHSKLQSNQ